MNVITGTQLQAGKDVPKWVRIEMGEISNLIEEYEGHDADELCHGSESQDPFADEPAAFSRSSEMKSEMNFGNELPHPNDPIGESEVSHPTEDASIPHVAQTKIERPQLDMASVPIGPTGSSGQTPSL
jgi:hypothetical protein